MASLLSKAGQKGRVPPPYDPDDDELDGEDQAPDEWAFVDTLSTDEKLRLWSRLGSVMPPSSLKDINLSEELVRHFMRVSFIFERVTQSDSRTPANQQSQVANSLSAVMDRLKDAQSKVYTSERLKRIESLFLNTIKTSKLPDSVINDFLIEYEAKLAAL